ncbi:hypothetical protein [Nonomuraea sp. NPDC049158]|uniref:hypothetical protein n=1 Tax=Nonomuraea sp. NPDC049158 TaxID=3155649 RepID=UPI0033E130DF
MVVIRSAVVAAIFGLFFLVGGAASAESGQLADPPSAADLQNAHAAAATYEMLVKLADLRFPDSQPRPDGQPSAASVGEKTIPVYEITPAFARGETGAPVGRLSYVAVPARTGDGAPVTVAMTDDGGWRMLEIASGTQEEQMAAGLSSPDASLLYEPQIDAWYEITGGKIRLLSTSTSAETAPKVYSVADYQARLVSRYADKQAGSDYDRQGMAGGYAPSRTPSKPPPPWLIPVVLVVAVAVVSLAGFRHLRRTR